MSNENELLVAKILRRYESDVPAVKQHLRDGEDRMLVEALRSAQAAVARRPILSDEAVERAQAEFTEYFVRNYPGPATIIGNPNWHAPKVFRAALHAIRTAAFSPATSSPGWQPIETAPKDGTEVILGREGRIMVGEYNVRMGRFKSWLTSHGLEHPTHWMPLPAAPAHREVGE